MTSRGHFAVGARALLCPYALWLLLVSACGTGDETLRIAVLLPASGSGDVGWREPLEWARAHIEAAGGVAGRSLELVYVDSAQGDLSEKAGRLAADPSIVAVIGPETSAGVFQVAPTLIKVDKPLVSPSATSGDIFRAFGSNPYVWRTVESDIAQVQTMLWLGTRGNAGKVALLTSADAYGGTFFDWFGFFATELDLEIGAVHRYDQNAVGCEEHVATVLAGQPEVLFVVPSTYDTAICVVEAVRARSPGTRMFFADGGQFPGLIETLGDAAEGLEGTSLAPDPASGFEIAYRVHFDRPPPPYAANTYDALLLLAYGLERSHGQGGTALASALTDVVGGRGTTVSWYADGVRRALQALRTGKLPDISGATGPLEFDRDQHTELVGSTYGHWRVEHGAFVTVDWISTGESNRGTSLARSMASERLLQTLATDTNQSYHPSPKQGMWALIAAVSSGWSNYRHQADALAKYQLLRRNGVPDDRIILILADDLSDHPDNAEPGVVRNVAGGPNLYADVEVDYRLAGVSAQDILDVLAGHRSERLPHVIDSGPDDNIFVFIVGHGDSDGVHVGGQTASLSGEITTVLGALELGHTIEEMFADRRYRRMLMAVEACHAGVLGEHLRDPGVMLITGANPFESSFATNYDPSLRVWLADEFAFQLFRSPETTPEIVLSDLYRNLYLQVGGSHVSVYNNRRFGDAGDIQLQEFLEP